MTDVVPGPALRLVLCPPALHIRAGEIVDAAFADPPTVPGVTLAALLPPGIHPGPGWPGGNDLLGLATSMEARLVVLGDTVIGGCGPTGVPTDGCQEIGYGLSPAFRGRGLGTASVRLLVKELVPDGVEGAGGTHAVGAYVLEGNEPSWRLLETLGFRQVESDRAAHRRYRWPPSP